MRSVFPLLILTGCILNAPVGEPVLIDDDEDGFLLTEDCDDDDPEVNPDGEEICDAIDNDCDGAIDGGRVCDRELAIRQTATLDVLFVVDDSATMLEFQERMADGLTEMLRWVTGLDADTHVGVITTDMADPLKSGRLQAWAGERWITPTSDPEVVAGWTDEVLVAGETGSGTEQGLDATVEALTTLRLGANDGFRRTDAHLTVVALSNEVDQSEARLTEVLDVLASISPTYTVHAVVPVGEPSCQDGTLASRYVDLAALSGGTYLSVCTPDYSPFLSAIGQISAQEGLRRRFQLPGTADPTAGLEVVVTLPAGTTRTLDPDEINLSSDATEVVLVDPPPAGSEIILRYRHLPPRP